MSPPGCVRLRRKKSSMYSLVIRLRCICKSGLLIYLMISSGMFPVRMSFMRSSPLPLFLLRRSSSILRCFSSASYFAILIFSITEGAFSRNFLQILTYFLSSFESFLSIISWYWLRTAGETSCTS